MIIRFDFKKENSIDKPGLLYFVKDECKCEYDKTKSFTHNVAELYFIIDGRGHSHVEKNDYEIVKNSIYVINPYTAHGEYVEKHTEFSYYILGISNFSIPTSVHSEIPKTLQGNSKIKVILNYLFDELSENKDNKKEMTNMLFDMLVIEIERLYKTKIESSNPMQENIASRIKNYIEVNYLGDCSSKMIADFFNKKLNTIEVKFKNQFGISMQQYILKLRIETAKKHILYNNMSVRDLALNCGFYNPSYFAWYFKKLVGMSPTQYKKMIDAQKIKEQKEQLTLNSQNPPKQQN